MTRCREGVAQANRKREVAEMVGRELHLVATIGERQLLDRHHTVNHLRRGAVKVKRRHDQGVATVRGHVPGYPIRPS